MKRLHVVFFSSIILLVGLVVANAQETTFAGKWDTNFGMMELQVSGDQVNGNYTHDGGRITGTVTPDGRTLEGTWSEAPTYQPSTDAGDVIFTLSPDSNNFTGRWWSGPQTGGGSGWTGTRIGSGPTTGPPSNPSPGPTTGGGVVMEPYSDDACNPMNGDLIVPAGKRAYRFSASFISYNWKACSVDYEVDTIDFIIADTATNMAVYRYYKYKNGGFYEPDGALENLNLGTGNYYVYVQGGRNSKLRLTYTLFP